MNIALKAYSVFLFIIVFVGGMVACGPKKTQPETNTASDMQEVLFDSAKIQIDIDRVDSMFLLFPDSNDQCIIAKDHQSAIAGSMLAAQYDTAWNDKGIMVKMVAPDYTIIIRYKENREENDDWLMMWKDGGMIKFKDKWFLLAGDKKETLYQIFDGYRKR